MGLTTSTPERKGPGLKHYPFLWRKYSQRGYYPAVSDSPENPSHLPSQERSQDFCPIGPVERTLTSASEVSCQVSN